MGPNRRVGKWREVGDRVHKIGMREGTMGYGHGCTCRVWDIGDGEGF